MNMPFVWLDGHIVQQADAMLAIDNHTLHYGTGVFEGIRSYAVDEEPCIFELQAHIERLLRSAGTMRIQIGHSAEQLMGGCLHVLKANGLTDAYLRPLVFIDDVYGAAARSNGVGRAAILAAPVQKTDDVTVREAIVSSMRRSRANSDYHHAKTTGQYSIVHYAAGECRARNANQAVFLDDRGVVCECLTDNIFVVTADSIITPPAYLPIIQGITRATVINLLREAGLNVIEREFGVDELQAAQEIFTTSTAGEIQAITSLDQIPVADRQVGEVTRLVARMYGNVKRGGVRVAEGLG